MKHIKEYNQLNENIWSEIRNDYEDDDQIYIDAWINDDGRTIAKIDILTDEITYYDDRAKTDKYAQEIIKDTIDNIDPDRKIEIKANTYNL